MFIFNAFWRGCTTTTQLIAHLYLLLLIVFWSLYLALMERVVAEGWTLRRKTTNARLNFWVILICQYTFFIRLTAVAAAKKRFFILGDVLALDRVFVLNILLLLHRAVDAVNNMRLRYIASSIDSQLLLVGCSLPFAGFRYTATADRWIACTLWYSRRWIMLLFLFLDHTLGPYLNIDRRLLLAIVRRSFAEFLGCRAWLTYRCSLLNIESLESWHNIKIRFILRLN